MSTEIPKSHVSRFVDQLNRSYSSLHTAKEDAFWTAYMGLADDPSAAREDLARKEIELTRFLADPGRLESVRTEIAAAEAAIDGLDETGAEKGRETGGETGGETRADTCAETREKAGGSRELPTEDDMVSLAGWLATFEAHVIEDAGARALAEDIVAAEGRLAGVRGAMTLGYRTPSGERIEASSVRLGVLVASDPDAGVRRSAWEGLRSIEPHVLGHGFIELVRQRNRLGRMLGGEDYYDWKTRRVEGMTKAEVFELLDELEERTRERAQASLAELRAKHGASEVTPWNLRYLVSGDVTRLEDPYFPFARALERWGRSFAALGIRYRGAELVLDLLDRKGKYENGFMHGPGVAWRDRGRFHPARIQFTANAIPGMMGSGRRAVETLFHEGGHAAHFANVDMPAPCFGQEFAPTSVAFAETQSMLLDSLISDADWQVRYARTAPRASSGGSRGLNSDRGQAFPLELIERAIQASQPFSAWSLRSMCAVCYAERAIYEIPDAELDGQRVLDAIRDVERRLLLLDQGSPRPVLSVPHLLAGDSSAYYHGYVLAAMAVEQTRVFFRDRDGHLVDNPRLGPDLEEAYWRPGNSRGFRDFIENLTHRPLTAECLARKVNRSSEEALSQARAAVRREPDIPAHTGPIQLDALIRVVHGRELIATNEEGFEPCAERFAGWIEAYARSNEAPSP